MKTTINSSDGLGDFVLRMPLVEALLSDGHRVQLLIGRLAVDLVRDLFPEVDLVIFENDPFRDDTKKLRKPFRREIECIRRFSPDLYVAGAFQLNFFDEVFLRERLPNLRVAGFEAEEAFWPSGTSVDPFELSREFSPKVRVPTGMPEGLKNLRLAEAILGKQGLTASAPRRPNSASLAEARRLLTEHGFPERQFVVVCVGSRPGLLMKDWGENNWAALLREIGPEEGRTFMFLGNPKEAASIERLRANLPSGSKHVSLAANPPSVSVSYALISLASAYLGRDSGVMHLAAAAGIPVLAVFSGGHWPRFLPQAEKGIVVTRLAPCRGCNFSCPFPEPWCVSSLPVDPVAEAWRRLPEVSLLEIVELKPDSKWAELAARTDAAAFAREAILPARRDILRRRKKGLWQRLRDALISE